MKKLFLIGYMGCGKSSLGRKLAKASGMQFMDMDSIIEQREGASISDIFHYQGEHYFRDVESALIRELGQIEGDMVISTGGGAPAWGENMSLMNSLGTTLYLRRTAEQIASRLSPHGRQKRPKLRGLDDEQLVAFMQKNMAERHPYYAQAKHTIECAELSDAELVEYILKLVSDNK